MMSNDLSDDPHFACKEHILQLNASLAKASCPPIKGVYLKQDAQMQSMHITSVFYMPDGIVVEIT